jgi:YVTN family beta-propeller protein
LDNNGTFITAIPVGSNPTGVSVDANGKVWVTNLGSDSIMRIDPNTNAVDLTVPLRAGSAPYNYSDMTGIVGLQAARSGNWVVVHDSTEPGTDWGTISWTSSEPAGTSVVVEARAADTEGGLGGETFVAVSNGAALSGMSGQYIEIRAILSRDVDVEESPILYDLTVEVANLPPDCSSASASLDCLWPPNHKFVDISILGVTDPDGDPVTITITGITSDEATATDLGAGGAKHAPDATGVGTDTASVRAERSGLGDGRVYEISFEASDGEGGVCENSVMVKVPHDRSKKTCTAIDSGQIYDATTIN